MHEFIEYARLFDWAFTIVGLFSALVVKSGA